MAQAVKDSFYDETYNGVDWERVRERALAKAFGSRAETYAQITADLALLGDPWTRLILPDEYANVSRRLYGQLDGVGLEIGPSTEGVARGSVKGGGGGG